MASQNKTDVVIEDCFAPASEARFESIEAALRAGAEHLAKLIGPIEIEIMPREAQIESAA